jgi:hypothetical protein
VKIGRAALDDDAIRLIEELNPFVEFDWPRILKGQDAPPSEPRVPVEVRRQRPQRSQERSESRPMPRPEPRETPRSEAVAPPAHVEQPAAEFADFKEALQVETVSAPAEPIPDVIVAAHARIGAEGVARLRARHAEIRARIGERVTDPARREELEAQANRLSPDAWATDADVTQALDQYEAVLASLREVVGRKRRRRRRGSRSGESADPADTGSSEAREVGSSDGETDAEGQTSGSAEASESREEPEDTGL